MARRRKRKRKQRLDPDGNATRVFNPKVYEPIIFVWDLEWGGKTLKTYGSGWHGDGYFVHQIDSKWYAVHKSIKGAVSESPRAALDSLQKVLDG